MPKRGIVNVKMVITEEKILSNIDKVQKLINPNSKKQIIELDDNSFFKDLVESIKTYLVEYPKKKNFPKNIYDSAYQLVEYATNQFEENTKQIEKLIKQREFNIKTATMLKQTLAIVESHDENWKRVLIAITPSTSEDVIEAFNIIGNTEDKNSPEYLAAVKLVNARIANLESNLHIEIDMERVEDRSKALSYIGIEIADALKLIPVPAQITTLADTKAENVVATVAPSRAQAVNQTAVGCESTFQQNNMARNQQQAGIPIQNQTNNIVVDRVNPNESKAAYQEYYADTRQEVKESFWAKFKNSKIIQTLRYAFRAKVVLQLPQGSRETKQ